MLRAALELAVESQKISTSLIQRRLSLGYGRAAKLIDRMEQLGIYEVAPEDFALAEYADTSKLELQKIVREGLDYLRKELE